MPGIIPLLHKLDVLNDIDAHGLGNTITVERLVPPPGVAALKASWWVCNGGSATVYAHRQIVLKDGQATAAKLRQIQAILTENLVSLVGPDTSGMAGPEREVA